MLRCWQQEICNTLFDTSASLVVKADVREAGLDPLAHYPVDGRQEGHNPSPRFNTGA